MNFEKFQEMKNKMEKLPKVEFFSFNKDAVILKNKENKALYQIPLTEQEDGSFILHLKDGQKVADGERTIEQEFLENKKMFKDNVKKIFTSYKEGIESVKNNFKTFVNIDPTSFAKKEEKKTFEESIKELTNHKHESIRNINAKFQKQLIDMNEDKHNFIQLFHVFDEENNLKTHDLNYDQLKEQYEESEKIYKAFDDKLKKMSKFHKSLNEIVMNEEFANRIISKINFTENLKITIPKALVMAKQNFNEDVNINDISKKVINLYNEIFGSDEENPMVFNRHLGGFDGGPVFLKFTSGKYSVRDVETLAHELEQSYYVIPDLTDEGLLQIADWKNQCDYMSRTGLVSDKKMDEIINTFNSKFALNAEDAFNDGENSLGFKDASDMRETIKKDIHDRIGESKVTDMSIEEIDEEPMEDDEEFEIQKDAVIA